LVNRQRRLRPLFPALPQPYHNFFFTHLQQFSLEITTGAVKQHQRVSCLHAQRASNMLAWTGLQYRADAGR
jgi:hypothetical protein